MSPLPCSPVSNSTASESYSVPNTSEEESDVSLTTPRAGPSDPALRTSVSLSRPSVPTFSGSPESEAKARNTFKLKPDSYRTDISDEAAHTRPDSGKAPSYAIDSSGNGQSRKSSVRFSRPESSSSRQRALHPLQTSGGMARASPPTSPFGSGHQRADGHEAAESSADENTAIFRRENTAARAYGAAGASDGVVNDADGTSVRRRTDAGKAKDGQGDSNAQSGGRNSAEADASNSADSSSWWKRTAEKYGSIELENKGSVARDHLALERTFLAWLRTSLSFASIGIAITQLFRLNTSLSSGNDDQSPSPSANDPAAHLKQVGKPLGATFLGISILILLLGFNRYFEGQHYVIRGKFPASRASIVLVSLVAGALIVASLAVVLVVAPSAFET